MNRITNNRNDRSTGYVSPALEYYQIISESAILTVSFKVGYNNVVENSESYTTVDRDIENLWM